MNTLTVIAFILAAQAQPGPIPLAGTAPGFQKTVLAAAQALETGDFETAKDLVSRLPKKHIRMKLDDSKLSSVQKVTFKTSAQDATDLWIAAISGLKIEFVEKGSADIVISFAEELPIGLDSGLPQGLVTFTSDDPLEPRLEGVIALKRLLPPIEVEAVHVQAEIAYLIGEFLGLARYPKLGSIMGRTDGLGSVLSPVDPVTARSVATNFELVYQLSQAIKTKTRLVVVRPRMLVKEKEFDFGSFVQGQTQEFKFEVTNLGNGPMNLSIRPDCSCFVIRGATSIAPQSTELISVWMDTSEFFGPQEKGLYLYSNDAENPVHKITVRAQIQPLFRFLSDSKRDQTFFADETGGKATLYLVYPEGKPLSILESKVSGLLGQVTVTPWQGQLADPVLREPIKPRVGYKLDLMVSPSTLNGRVPVTISLITDHERFRNISTTIYFQRGVIAQPQAVYFGNLNQGIARAWVMLYQAGIPFKVTKIEPMTSDVSARVEEYGNGDQKLIVELHAGAKTGDILTSIKVFIEGAQEPLIIPVQAHVK